MAALRFAVFGAGFWARPQLAAWREVPGAECAAIFNRTRAKAERLAKQLGIPAVYDDPVELLRRESLDFVDIITAPGSHEEQVLLVASHGLPVICQKPMSTSLASAERMVAACARANVPFFVHENWRWQGRHPPGEARARRGRDREAVPGAARHRLRLRRSSSTSPSSGTSSSSCSPTWAATSGRRPLPLRRGDPASMRRPSRVHPDIRGEDVATVMLRMRRRASRCWSSWATPENHLERERFPETFIFVEGERGSIELAPDFWVRVTTAAGTHVPTPPAASLPLGSTRPTTVHASIVPCNADLLAGSVAGGRPRPPGTTTCGPCASSSLPTTRPRAGVPFTSDGSETMPSAREWTYGSEAERPRRTDRRQHHRPHLSRRHRVAQHNPGDGSTDERSGGEDDLRPGRTEVPCSLHPPGDRQPVAGRTDHQRHRHLPSVADRRPPDATVHARATTFHRPGHRTLGQHDRLRRKLLDPRRDAVVQAPAGTGGGDQQCADTDRIARRPHQKHAARRDQPGRQDDPEPQVFAEEKPGQHDGCHQLEVRRIDAVDASTRARPSTSRAGPNAPPATTATTNGRQPSRSATSRRRSPHRRQHRKGRADVEQPGQQQCRHVRRQHRRHRQAYAEENRSPRHLHTPTRVTASVSQGRVNRIHGRR